MSKCFEGDTTTLFETEFKAKVESLISEIKGALTKNSGPYGVSLLDSL